MGWAVYAAKDFDSNICPSAIPRQFSASVKGLYVEHTEASNSVYYLIVTIVKCLE